MKISAPGKVRCYGGKSEEDCRFATRKVARILQKKLGLSKARFRDSEFKIVSMKAKFDVRFRVRLDRFLYHHSESAYVCTRAIDGE